MATISDVARASGVSQATVSYVLNNGPRPVRPETRERVLSAIRDLKYFPSAVARGLQRKRMNTVGVIFPHLHASLITNPYFSQVLDGILRGLDDHSQNTTLFTGQAWSDVEHSLPIFADGRCDGLLLIAPPIDSDIIPALQGAAIPFVAISFTTDDASVASVDVDNVEAADAIVSHLIGLGHRRIAMLCGPEMNCSVPLRRRGYQQALKRAGIPLDPRLIFQGDYTRRSGYEQAWALLTQKDSERPTAIFGCSDEIALGAAEAARKLGCSVPGELSLVGFDDIPDAAAAGLTTARQPLRLLGESAVSALMDRATGTATAAKQLLRAEIVVRSSSARPFREEVSPAA